MGINPELPGVRTDPADGGFPVGHGFEGAGAMAERRAIVRADGDHSLGRPRATFRIELERRAPLPSTAEEDDGRTRGGRRPSRAEEMQGDKAISFWYQSRLMRNDRLN